MQFRRLALVLSVLMIFALVISGCGPRPQQGELAKAAASDQVVVDLPALNIDYNDQGEASMFGLPLSQVGAMLGQDLGQLNLSPEKVQAFKDKDIQHLFVNLTPSGLSLYVNGKPLPSFTWDKDSLASSGDLIGVLSPDNADTIKGLLPVLGSTSLGVVLRFPKASGAADLPLVAAPADKAALLSTQQQAVTQVLGELGIPPLLGSMLGALPPLTLQYAADGTFQLQGLAPFIAAQIPPGALDGLKLKPDQLAGFKENGIQSLNIKTTPDGLNLAVNGKALPTLTWGNGEMVNLVELGVDSGVLENLAGLDESTLGTLQQLGKFAPILQSAKLDVTLNFPQ